MARTLPRRAMLGGAAVFVALPAVACSREPSSRTSGDHAQRSRAAPVAMTVHKDPTCPCCEEWADLARKAGFSVRVVPESDMQALKRRLGVPAALQSCHTTEVDGYVVEGHVPLDDVRRLLSQRPALLVGLTVSGMPRGSPGMEMPDGAADPYRVLAFDRAGQSTVYSTPKA